MHTPGKSILNHTLKSNQMHTPRRNMSSAEEGYIYLHVNMQIHIPRKYIYLTILSSRVLCTQSLPRRVYIFAC